MPIITDTQLGKDIRKNQFSSRYLLYGNETYSIQKCVAAILKKNVTADFASFNLQKFDEKNSISEISDAIFAVPIMAAQKCVTACNLDLPKLNERDFALLLELLADQEKSTVFILFFSNSSVDFRSAKFKKLIDATDKNRQGIVTQFLKKDTPALRKIITDRVRKAGFTISPTATSLLIDRCCSQLGQINNELDKLIAHTMDNPAENGEISKEITELLCANTMENTVFDLANAILKKDYRNTFILLDHLLYQRVESFAILGALTSSFIDIYRARLGLSASKSAKQISTDFQYNPRREFIINNAMYNAENDSVQRIHSCFQILVETDALLKSSKLSNRLLLEQMLGKMLSGISKKNRT